MAIKSQTMLRVLALLLITLPSFSQPTRLIEYTVDEGTWISLDLASDGQTLVFELVGDVYQLPMQGGTATAIITGNAFQSQPRFSPDGTRLSYISDESGSDNVWIASATGSEARNLTKLNRGFLLSPEWSADGKFIFVTVVDGQGLRSGAFTRGDAELWQFEVATGAGMKVVGNTNGPASPLISSPPPGPFMSSVVADGRYLYYTSVRPRAYGVRQGASSQVIQRNIESGAEERLWLEGVNAMKAGLSPDGKWLIYFAEYRGVAGLRCRDMATGTERWLIRQMQRSELEGRASRDVLPNYDITADSKSVVVAYGGKIHQVDIASGADAVIPFSARVSIPVFPRIHHPQPLDNGLVKARVLQHLALSDDGRAVLSTFGRLYVVDVATGKSVRLTNAAEPREFMPAWSADGKWIVYASWGHDGGQLWKVSTKGNATPVQLTTTAGFWIDPVFSNDGKEVYALFAPLGSGRAVPEMPSAPELMRPPDTDIVKLPATGGAATIISRANNARVPQVVRNSDRIWLSAPEGLISIQANGTDKKVHLVIPPRNVSAFMLPTFRQYRVSPDGTSVLGLLNDRLYKTALPTQENTTVNLLDTAECKVLSNDIPRTAAWSPQGKVHGWIIGTKLIVSRSGSIRTTTVNITADRQTPTGSLVLSGGKAITMKGDEIIPVADIVITNNRITAIGPRGSISLPKGARIVDITGKAVMPGIIDVHGHWGIRSEQWEPECPSTYANLAFGITTVRDPQSSPDMFGYADWFNSGEVLGPRLFPTGPSVNEINNISSLDEAREFVRRYKENYGTTQLKLYLPGTRQQRQWLGHACRELGVMPTAEAGGDAREVITHFLDGYNGNEHSLSNQPMYDDIAQLFARTGVTYTPTLLVAFGAALPIYRVLADEKPYNNDRLKNFFPEQQLFHSAGKRGLWFTDEDMNYKEAGAGANAVLKAGGHVALGGHGEMQGLSNHWEMRLLNEGGMDNHSVLRVATIEGAETLGIDREVGSLEPGKLADLIVLEADPLINIRNTTTIQWVMTNGRLLDAATLDQSWPVTKPLPKPWWRK